MTEFATLVKALDRTYKANFTEPQEKYYKIDMFKKVNVITLFNDCGDEVNLEFDSETGKLKVWM